MVVVEKHKMTVMREKGMIHSDDEEEGEIIVNEEDDEAIEIANNPHFAKTTLV